uniref:J domain-containing protein n=2 Tax=Parascaris univalens TaxID=6257 RepID=A0A915B4Z1_PARUN
MLNLLYTFKIKPIIKSSTRPIYYSTQILKTHNYYELLGVSPKATPTEIKNAYYSKSKLVHPDSINHMPEEERTKRQRAFVELKEAYDVLRRPADRRIYDDRLSGRISPEYMAAEKARNHPHGYGSPPHYDYFGQDWRAFSESELGFKAKHMTPEELRKLNQRQWAVIIKYTLIGFALVLIYQLFYLLAVFRRDRQLETLIAKDEIARSFLRQREFADRRNDQQHTDELAQLLKANIDEAHQRRMESLKKKNPREIREEYRWLKAVREVDPSKRFRIRRRAAIEEEEEAEKRAALLKSQAKVSSDGHSKHE